MSNRNDFSPRTRTALALRAGHRGAICNRSTSGPSEESPMAHASIGEAAHISGARPGSRRFDPSLAPEQRSSIENGIWLCAAHARLIDRDAGTYTIERLQQAKRDHEARCASELLEPSVNDDRALDERRGDLFGVGPDIVCLGQITNVDEAEWGFRIEHFVVGDLHDVVAFINGYEQRSAYDRHVLDNKLGDGRVLGGAPSLATSNNRYVLRCPVQPKFPRTSAADFPQDLALFSNGNDSGLVSGLAAFSQHVFVSL